MKWNNPLIVFDLETTDCDIHKIIEIGAVALHPATLEKLGEFTSVANPAPYPVSDFVLDLTKIPLEEIEQAASWPTVAKEFEGWAREVTGKDPKNCRLVAWGSYFDSICLRNEYVRNNLPYAWSGTCVCAKSASLIWCSLAGKRTDKLSVSLMAETHLGLSLPVSGNYHRALYDAEVTAKIFKRVVNDLGNGVFVDGSYISVSKRPAGQEECSS